MKLTSIGFALGATAICLGIASLGVANHWGIAQFGTVATWVFGVVTLSAFLLAFAESRRSIDQTTKSERRALHQRRVDHEIERRREVIKAVADFWSSFTANALTVRYYLNFFDDLPATFDVNKPRAGTASAEALAEEIWEAARGFIDSWMREVEGPLLYALVSVKGTALDDPMRQLNKSIRALIEGAVPALAQFALKEGKRPGTSDVETHFSSLTKQRQAFLELLRTDLALDWKSVNAAVVAELKEEDQLAENEST